jgi:protoheme IX farnesyltransferase
MSRTTLRPLPAGKIATGSAFRFSLTLIGTGYVILFFTGSLAAPFWGLLTVLWYNGFYTWWKRRSAFAAIPGALVGTIPPVIGWMTGGGHLYDARLGILCFSIFMWQIPHFFTHMMAFGREYEGIGFPSLMDVFTEGQLRRLTFVWILSAAVSLQLLGLYGLIRWVPVRIALAAVSLWFAMKGLRLIMGGDHPSYISMFRGTNITLFAILFLIFTDRCSRYIV